MILGSVECEKYVCVCVCMSVLGALRSNLFNEVIEYVRRD